MPDLTLTESDKKVLRKIKDVFEKTHWIKGIWRTKENGKELYCLSGAIGKFSEDRGQKERLQRRIASVLPRITHYRSSAPSKIISFNDSSSTQKEDVIKVINDTLKKYN